LAEVRLRGRKREMIGWIVNKVFFQCFGKALVSHPWIISLEVVVWVCDFKSSHVEIKSTAYLFRNHLENQQAAALRPLDLHGYAHGGYKVGGYRGPSALPFL
jgi:hypothetical protein